MATGLERRIEKLEERAPALPCPDPKHKGLYVYTIEREKGTEKDIEELTESLSRCPHCKDKTQLILILQHKSDEVRPAATMDPEVQKILDDYGSNGRSYPPGRARRW